MLVGKAMNWALQLTHVCQVSGVSLETDERLELGCMLLGQEPLECSLCPRLWNHRCGKIMCHLIWDEICVFIYSELYNY